MGQSQIRLGQGKVTHALVMKSQADRGEVEMSKLSAPSCTFQSEGGLPHPACASDVATIRHVYHTNMRRLGKRSGMLVGQTNVRLIASGLNLGLVSCVHAAYLYRRRCVLPALSHELRCFSGWHFRLRYSGSNSSCRLRVILQRTLQRAGEGHSFGLCIGE